MNISKLFFTVAYASGGGGRKLSNGDKSQMMKDYRAVKKQYSATKVVAKEAIKAVGKVTNFVTKLF